MPLFQPGPFLLVEEGRILIRTHFRREVLPAGHTRPFTEGHLVFLGGLPVLLSLILKYY